MRLLGSFLLLSCALANLNSAPSISADFFHTLREGNARKIRSALEAGAPVEGRDEDGNTPLMLAAVYGDAACVRAVLESGATVNATNATGATALLRAATDYDKVRLLVERGANVNARSAVGNTPLILAARAANSRATVALLLRHGAEAKATNFAGGNALMAAAAGGDSVTVRLLIEAGVNVNAQPTPDEPGFLFGGGRSALMWAAFRGNLPVLKQLLDAGAEVNAMGMFGTALSQAAWADRTAAAKLLIARGAEVNVAGPRDGFTPLHWAASTEERDLALVKLLLEHKANPNAGGGDPVDAYLNVEQTPLMLADRHGNAAARKVLEAAGATKATAEISAKRPAQQATVRVLDAATLKASIARAMPLLQKTAIYSKNSFVTHESKQDCTSCHSQYLPLATFGVARERGVALDEKAANELAVMVRAGEFKGHEMDLQPLFHPDAVQTKGYAALGYALAERPADDASDAWVNHLAAIQGPDGQWYNNLPRPPMQTGDIGATALAVQALTHYSLPGRRQQFTKQVDRARQWLWKAKSQNTDSRALQLMGLSWAGESPARLQSLARALIASQQADGGWAQLPGLPTDAYATGQAVYALRTAAGLSSSHPAVARGLKYLVENQLEDGTWHVRRRAFPFQPTMNSGFPHGRDSWISTAGTSWAVLALGVKDAPTRVTAARERELAN